MILEEGGVGIENTVLFGKYRICRVIGTGRRGTVFLAVHLGLEEYRAVKRVSKECIDYEQFRSEGLILKELRHPGVPVVYDLEEDESYCYLIEEYLEGDSLYDLVNQLGHLSEAAVIHYGIQICRIVNHLHSAGTFPILHLDLQPKNLLLSHDMIKLIDFDHAATLSDANLTVQRYGTVGCAAPEQYTDQPLDERTDIYAIGVILHYLGCGHYPGVRAVRWQNRKLGIVIRTCLNTDRRRRYLSVAHVISALERADGCHTDVFMKDQLSSLTIALAGSKSGVGTTHLAIGLLVYLKIHGIESLYEEKNHSGAVRALASYFGSSADRNGYILINHCTLKPCYGECVKLESRRFSVRILDFDTDLQAVLDEEDLDAILLLGGGMWWEAGALESAVGRLLEKTEPIVILPCSVREHPFQVLGKVRSCSCFLAPYFPNPWKPTVLTDSFYQSVLAEITEWKGEKPTWLRKKIREIRRRIGGQLV